MAELRAALYDILAAFSRRTPTFGGGAVPAPPKSGISVVDAWRTYESTLDSLVTELGPPDRARLSTSLLANMSVSLEPRTNMTDSNLADCDLSNCSLRHVILTRACLSRSKMSAADLFEATMFRIQADEAILTGANLSKSLLIEADLRSANLEGANLSHADLSDAKLQNARLRGADLSEATLAGADVSGADFNRAILPANFDPSTVTSDDRTVWPWDPLESRLS